MNFSFIASGAIDEATAGIRFHVVLPWTTFYVTSFDEFERELLRVMPQSMWLQTRRLRPSEYLPDDHSIEFVSWWRRKQLSETAVEAVREVRECL